MSLPSVCVYVCARVCVCVYHLYNMFGLIVHHLTGDWCLALSGTLVLLFGVINVMYAWLPARFVSTLMLNR